MTVVRTGSSVDEIERDLLDNLHCIQGKFPAVATRNDWFLAAAYTVRDRLLKHWVESVSGYYERRARTVCYLSAEFLLGPQLGMNLLRLGLQDEFREALRRLGQDLDALIDHEGEPGLGSGGLGRLAACYLDSLATLGVPAIGYGIRYEFGIFDQEIRDGWQVEIADRWLRFGNPWEVARPEIAFDVKLGGHTEPYHDAAGRYRVRWVPGRIVRGTPYDTPVLGHGSKSAIFLRLWNAEATESFDFQDFNAGDYYGAVEEKVESESISKVLYPNDQTNQGRELRLKQQYFFCSCSLQDMIRLLLQRMPDLRSFHEKFAIQLNDTHPALAVPELMRLLLDDHALDWESAWEITRKSFSYTNHTLMPEALERWPVAMFGRLLPRHLEIVYEINRRFLDEVRRRFPGDEERARRLSLIDETGERYVRMAHVACVGSHAVNGVAALHTELLQREVLPEFAAMMPEKFSNKTNGVSPRRFLRLCNPRLSKLIDGAIGEGWVTDLERLRDLEPFAKDRGFAAEWRKVKLQNKADLARHIERTLRIAVDPESLFDVQVKRIHEYKRQHLNALHAATIYRRIKKDPRADALPRLLLFAGKAAPGYFLAKLIIKLIHSIAAAVDSDPDVRGRLKIVFLPDFNVQNAQRIYPAAELSEQISTAGKEASGTGNMKMALNGALTIGTLDGANVEIREAVGPENFFLFGLTAPQVADLWKRGYCPREIYESDPELRQTIDDISGGLYSPGTPGLFRPLVDSLLERDPFAVLADYGSYVKCQEAVARAYRDAEEWTRKSILNVARMGRFSSDRAIREYCREIWKVEVGA
jgi:starch phosphorylase